MTNFFLDNSIGSAIIITILVAFVFIVFYFKTKLQMKIWLEVIEQFLNEKSIKSKLKTKENEQEKKK